MSNDIGWISVHRKIRECDIIWKDKPFSRGQAWIDLLLLANHEDKKTMFDGNAILVKRGQRITSIRKLCEAWGWSNTKVTKFLDVLEMEQMITRKSDRKKTLITVLNYDIYQNVTTEKRHRNATETPQKRTNNNDNNDNNINKREGEKSARFIPPTLEEVRAYCQERKNNVDPEAFVAFYSSKNWYVGKSKMSSWKQAVITWEIKERSRAKEKKIEIDDKFRDFLEQNQVVDFNT